MFLYYFTLMSSSSYSVPVSLDPAVWGPPFWFFLHTLAISYPSQPNAVTKKKYYELFQNLPLFIPVEEMGNSFIKLLEEYPITAYMDDRESLIKWMHFIHNKINEKLEKPKISLGDFYSKYYEEYKPRELKQKEQSRWREKIIYVVVMAVAIFICVYLYQK